MRNNRSKLKNALAISSYAQGKTVFVLGLLCLVVFLAFGWQGAAQGVEAADISGSNEVTADEQNGLAKAKQEGEPIDDEQKRMEIAFWVLLAGIGVLFSLLLLISLHRASRSYKRRLHLGERGERTEYIDAWSRYRLKDDYKDDRGDGDGDGQL